MTRDFVSIIEDRVLIPNGFLKTHRPKIIGIKIITSFMTASNAIKSPIISVYINGNFIPMGT